MISTSFSKAFADVAGVADAVTTSILIPMHSNVDAAVDVVVDHVPPLSDY